MVLPPCPIVQVPHQTMKAPVNQDKGRNWVVRTNHDGQDLILKIFERGDPLFEQERAALRAAAPLAEKGVTPHLMALPEAELLTPEAEHNCLALSTLPGRTLTDVGLAHADIVQTLIQAADRVWLAMPDPTLTPAFPLHTQGQLCWCATPPVLPTLTIRDHLLELLLLTRLQQPFSFDEVADFAITAAGSLTWVDCQTFGLNHNDLHVHNVLLHKGRPAVVDLASTCISSRLVDLGGILAHVGFDHADTILKASIERVPAVTDDHGNNRDLIRRALAFFCLKRSLRRLAYLARLGLASTDPRLKRPRSNVHAILFGLWRDRP